MLARLFLGIYLQLLASNVIASLDDFYQFSQEQVKELNAEIGQDATMYWAHADWGREESAPLISLIVYEQSDDQELIGSYSQLKEAVRGMSAIKLTIFMQSWIAETIGTNQYRLQEYELDDDLSSLFFTGHYIEEVEKKVWQQFQVHQWSDDNNAKCIISSDVEERIGNYYSDSIIEAIVELMTVCKAALNDGTSYY